MPEIDVEQADRGQADDRIESGAGGRHQQLMVRDLDRHAGAGNLVAERMQERDGEMRDADLDRLRDRRHDRVRRRQGHGEVENREPQRAQKRAAHEKIECRNERGIHGQPLQLENAGDAGEHVKADKQAEQQCADERVAGPYFSLSRLELTPQQPCAGGDDDRRVAALLGRPGEPGHVEHRRQQDRRHAQQEYGARPQARPIDRLQLLGSNLQQSRNPNVSMCYPHEISKTRPPARRPQGGKVGPVPPLDENNCLFAFIAFAD